jgi:adenosylhomocysteine nucleosidase
MRIVVTFAVPSEFAYWRRGSHFARIQNSEPPMYRLRRGRDEIYGVITGIGMPRPPNKLRGLFAKTADLCIASGLAGALKKEHEVGSILVAKAVKGYAGRTPIQSENTLVQAATQCGAKVVDFFYTANSVVNSSSEKLRLGETADAVEMETIHILHEARCVGIPAVAVRAVSDAAENNLPVDFNRVISMHGRVDWVAMFSELVKAPSQLASFARFGLDSLFAARTLARFLDRYITFLIRDGSVQVSLDQMVNSDEPVGSSS